jgi:hypothetical protein
LPPNVAASLHARTGGRMRLATGDRIVVTLPDSPRRRIHLEAAQAALRELVTHAK